MDHLLTPRCFSHKLSGIAFWAICIQGVGLLVSGWRMMFQLRSLDHDLELRDLFLSPRSTECAALVTFLVVVIKHPNKSNLKGGGFIWGTL